MHQEAHTKDSEAGPAIPHSCWHASANRDLFSHDSIDRHFQENREIKGSRKRHLFTSICATAGDIVNAQRAGLSGDNVDMLVFLKENFRVEN